jgi:hypothetical protein
MSRALLVLDRDLRRSIDWWDALRRNWLVILVLIVVTIIVILDPTRRRERGHRAPMFPPKPELEKSNERGLFNKSEIAPPSGKPPPGRFATQPASHR